MELQRASRKRSAISQSEDHLFRHRCTRKLPPFDLLAGGPDLRQRIESGQPALEIVNAYAGELAEFDARRPRLYNAEGIPFQVIAEEMSG